MPPNAALDLPTLVNPVVVFAPGVVDVSAPTAPGAPAIEWSSIPTATPLPGVLRFGPQAAADRAALPATSIATTPRSFAAVVISASSTDTDAHELDAREATMVASPPPARGTCPSCGSASSDPTWCDRCGAELAPPAARPAQAAALAPLLPGTRFGLPPTTIELDAVASAGTGRVCWRAHGVQSGQQLEVVEVPLDAVSPTLPSSLSTVLRVPLFEERCQGRLLRAYAPETGRLLDELLGEAQPLEVCIDVTLAVARAFAELHSAGFAALGLHPQHVRLQGVGARLCWDGPFPSFAEPTSLRAPVRGFSAPEAFGRGEGRITPASDVFVLSKLLYYLASGAPRIEEVAESGVELPLLRDWRPDIPAGLEGVVRRGTARLASRRTPDQGALRAELLRARAELARRQAAPYARLEHKIAVDGHIGINKQKQRPINEDAFFARADPLRAKSLVLVADGVTHASLGTGNEASSLMVGAAAERWPRLLESRIADGEMAPRVVANLLASLARAGNNAIALRATALTTEPAPAPSEVMASTLVMALIDGNRLHVLNLGDSRAYLFSHGDLERLTADHDVKHELLRERRSLFEISSTRGGAQLTRFVGRMERKGATWAPVDPIPDLHHLTLLPGDRLLLCSDGLSDYVGGSEVEADAAIARTLAEYKDPARAAFELVVLANRGGGGDNITCIVVDVNEPGDL